MSSSFTNWFTGTYKAQRRKNRMAGLSFDTYEDRTLLSGVAIYPQPAAAVATEDVTPTAAPPADFSGGWFISTPEGNTDVVVQQEGKKVTLEVDLDGLLTAHGKVKGAVATLKFNVTIFGEKVKGKITSTLTSKDTMEGTVMVKKSPEGKFDLPFTGTVTIR